MLREKRGAKKCPHEDEEGKNSIPQFSLPFEGRDACGSTQRSVATCMRECEEKMDFAVEF